jgi:hypothetical protein
MVAEAFGVEFLTGTVGMVERADHLRIVAKDRHSKVVTIKDVPLHLQEALERNPKLAKANERARKSWRKFVEEFNK